ncbi:28031_t:CDS:2, partial [Gigaspora margarita]
LGEYITIKTDKKFCPDFVGISHTTKQIVNCDNNNNEILSDLELQNESESDLEIESTSNYNIKYPRLFKKNFKWNPIWLKFYPWLRAIPLTNSSKLYCEWCKKAKFNNIFTEVESVKKPLSIEKLRIIQNMHNMYWLVENNIVTFNIQDLCSLVEMQIQNKEEYIISTSACTISSVFLNTTILEEKCKYGSYSNDHAGHDFIEAIA